MRLFQIFIIANILFSISCTTTNTKPVSAVLEGQIKNAGNYQINLDESSMFKNIPVTKTLTDADGKFSMKVDSMHAGVYTFRIGKKGITMIFDGSEKNMHIEGDLTTFDKFDLKVEGSKSAKEYLETIHDLITEKKKPEDIEKLITSSDNTLMNMVLSVQVFQNSPQALVIQKNVYSQLQKKYPGSIYTKDFEQFLSQQTTAANTPAADPVSPAATPDKNTATQRVKAPEISAEDPTGKLRSLSSLKGKIVLLDFWASWCGPCRASNPHLVQMYQKYHSKGFDVFSVSLDGVDDQTRGLITPDQLKQQLNDSHNRWVNAITQDKLTWENHVSDLRKWNSKAARTYGVNSIPQAYLIDKEGNIVKSIPPGTDFEADLVKLLK